MTARTDTVTGKRKTFERARKPHEPPVDLAADERARFDLIVSSRHRDDWSPVQLLNACDLARLMVLQARVMDKAMKLQQIDEGTRTTLSMLSNAIGRHMRSLGLAAASDNRREEARRAQAEREAAEALKKMPSPLLNP